ncbi:MAG TPA: hypothetical protein VMU06_19680 [Stellaceae bacterium]|nr:hypothetical protein [Stellaceae bacterium]
MSAYNHTLQQIWHRYEEETGQMPATTRDAVAWGIERKLLRAPEIDPLEKLAEDMATALRAEYRIDAQGRKYRVNHAVRITRSGVQYTFWADLDHAARPHMEKAFSQRRKQIVNDCLQLKTDVDVYNDLHADQPPIQLVLNFTDDVAEIENLDRGKAA